MTTRRDKQVRPGILTVRQGKVLRYVASRTLSDNSPVPAEDCVVKIHWSDLPKTEMQATTTLSALTKLGLLEHVKYGYNATAAGIRLMRVADKRRMWMKAPPPAVTNRKRKSARRRPK